MNHSPKRVAGVGRVAAVIGTSDCSQTARRRAPTARLAQLTVSTPRRVRPRFQRIAEQNGNTRAADRVHGASIRRRRLEAVGFDVTRQDFDFEYQEATRS